MGNMGLEGGGTGFEEEEVAEVDVTRRQFDIRNRFCSFYTAGFGDAGGFGVGDNSLLRPATRPTWRERFESIFLEFDLQKLLGSNNVAFLPQTA